MKKTKAAASRSKISTAKASIKSRARKPASVKAVKVARAPKRRTVSARPAGRKARSGSVPVWQEIVARVKGFWGIAAVGGVFIVGGTLWHSHQPPEAPAPLQLPPPAQAPVAPQAPAAQAPAPQAPVAQAPVAQPPVAQPPVAQAPAPQPPAPPVAQAPTFPEGPLHDQFVTASQRPFDARITYWSEWLLNAQRTSETPGTVLVSTLGKVPTVEDSAPLIPPKFDCTTFVETVSALSRSHGAEEFFKNLIAIRYRDAVPGFTRRNHFPEADWIPNNERAGIVHDITRELAAKASVTLNTETKTIDRGKWLAEQKERGKVSRSIASVDDAWSRPVEATVTYISMADLPKVLDRLPNGAIVNLVRQKSDHHPVLIAHQGFIIRQGSMVLLRHASVGGNIRTLPLMQYLTGLSEKADAHNWPVVGINLNLVNG